MNNTKTEWCDSTWNPVTGCLHGCEYCYARGIARRFKGFEPRCGGEEIPEGKGTCVGSIHNTTHGETLHVFSKQPKRRLHARGYPSGKFVKASYPYAFEPTFHRYKLDEYAKKKGRTIFVCSMGDLFGDWVPDAWITAVFEACARSPQHRYLFLTKNIHGYEDFDVVKKDNYWYGQTWDCLNTGLTNYNYYEKQINQFLSIEPLQSGNIPFDSIKAGWFDWVIVGAETGKRKYKVTPRREWIDDIVKYCAQNKVPVFMKESLRGIMGDDFIQEYPWKIKEGNT